MRVYLVGVGRMGRVVARSLAPVVDLVLVGRDQEKLAAAAAEFGAGTAPLETDFAGAAAVILALPTESTADVLAAIAPRIPAEAVVINIATAVMRSSLNHLVPDEQLAAAKFVAHYYDLEAGGKAMLVVEAGSPRTEAITKEIMGHCGPVVAGKEEWVLTTNRAATEEAVRLALRMRRRMEMAGIPPEIIHQATTGVAVGSLRAFMDGRLGPFGQAVAERVLVELERKGL
ncbi:MAG TPA: NAD(P)-binding domain-containing protein [Symbiobacteriaceae bacterium]|nr:NAD(P)-binding domain-containing protein [Symbiobacteriaceae bacterium]